MVLYLIIAILILYVVYVFYVYFTRHRLPKTTEISGVVIDELQMLI